MSVKTRLAKLEQAAGPRGGLCQCGGGQIVWWDDDQPKPEPTPETCPKCGKPRQVLIIGWGGK